MKTNINELKIAARLLREKLESFKDKDQTVAMLYSQLDSLLSAAERGALSENIEPREIPGHRLFDETNIRDYSDLKSAYTNFYIELIGGRDWGAYKLIKEKISKT